MRLEMRVCILCSSMTRPAAAVVVSRAGVVSGAGTAA